MYGVLYYNNTDISFKDNLEIACSHYLKKYEVFAHYAQVHPDTFPDHDPDEDIIIHNVFIDLVHNVRPNHIWLIFRFKPKQMALW